LKVRKRDLRNLAQAPAKRGVRLLAIATLQNAESAFARVSVSQDEEALHDFRVALRRLRSQVRIYRALFRGSVKRKQERRLRDIARASNPSRDLEVVIEQLEDMTDLTDQEQEGARLLLERLNRARTRVNHDFIEEVLRDFPTLQRELLVCFSTYEEQLHLDQAPVELLGPHAARLSANLRQELTDRINEVLSVEHQIEAHRARIVGKKLRYLHEAFARDCDESRDVGDAVAAFQQSFGALHDAHLLLTICEREAVEAKPGEREPIAALREQVRKDRLKLFTEASQTYLGGRAQLLLDTIITAERVLREVANFLEIERKFLLRRFPRVRAVEQLDIVQGYVPGDAFNERIRRIESQDGTRFYRTVKAGSGLQRIEVEEETTKEVFKKLFGLTRGRRIRKRRYLVHDHGHTWEIDRFLDRKLVIAEVELADPDTPVQLPDCSTARSRRMSPSPMRSWPNKVGRAPHVTARTSLARITVTIPP
jgi:CHAD domain-containing protein/CYTH domain-containing protein